MTLNLSGVEARVCTDIAERQQLGIVKYGVTVENNPLPLKEWLNHAYQEGLDQVIYLKRAMEELCSYKEAFEAAKAFIDCHIADPDITDEMCAKYHAYLKAKEKLP